MGRIISHPVVLLGIRLTLVGLFAMAALPKIQDPVAFANSVAGFRVVGPELSAWVALLLPWLELAIAIGLLTPWLRRASGLCIALLLMAFIALHASAWARGLNIDCGCFGEAPGEPEQSYVWLILRNTGLLIGCGFLLACDWRNKSLSKDS